MDNKLIVIAEQSGLAKNRTEELIKSFADDIKTANKLVEGVEGIVVKDENDDKTMNEARERRIKLKNIRVSVENKRKELKEQSLREGKAIDGMANIIKAIIVPAEEYLEKQEKFKEELEKERKRALAVKREAELSRYDIDAYSFDLVNMQQDAYEQLLRNSKDAYESRLAREAQEEKDRIEAEKKRIEEEKRLRAENDKLRKEREEQAEKLRKIQEEQDRLAEEAKKREQEEREAELAKLKAEKEALAAPDKEKMKFVAGVLSDCIAKLSEVTMRSPEYQDRLKMMIKNIEAIKEGCNDN